MTEWITNSDFGTMPTDYRALILSLLLAFVCGHAVAWTYMATHTGLSYSRSFVNSLIVIPTIVAMVMLVLANSLVTAFGMMAVFAIVRFRNVLRDTLDTSYVLTVIVIGLAAGTRKYATAAVGCALTCGIMVYLYLTAFGTRHRYDMILNLHWARPVAEMSDLAQLLQRHCRKTQCASQRSSESFEGTDLSYRLLLRDPRRMDDLLKELHDVSGVSRISGLKSEEESEI